MSNSESTEAWLDEVLDKEFACAWCNKYSQMHLGDRNDFRQAILSGLKTRGWRSGEEVAKIESKATKSLVNEMELDMRLHFDANVHDFATFDAMLAYMNGWVADKYGELHQGETEGRG